MNVATARKKSDRLTALVASPKGRVDAGYSSGGDHDGGGNKKHERARSQGQLQRRKDEEADGCECE